MNQEPIISIRDLILKFKSRTSILTVLRDISLDIYDGEVLALVGESGSGKTVLTKTITNMIENNGWISNGAVVYFPNAEAQNDPNAAFKKPVNLVNFHKALLPMDLRRNVLSFYKKNINEYKKEIKVINNLNELKITNRINFLKNKIDTIKLKLDFKNSNVVTNALVKVEKELSIFDKYFELLQNESLKNQTIVKIEAIIEENLLEMNKIKTLTMFEKKELIKNLSLLQKYMNSWTDQLLVHQSLIESKLPHWINDKTIIAVATKIKNAIESNDLTILNLYEYLWKLDKFYIVLEDMYKKELLEISDSKDKQDLELKLKELTNLSFAQKSKNFLSLTNQYFFKKFKKENIITDYFEGKVHSKRLFNRFNKLNLTMLSDQAIDQEKFDRVNEELNLVKKSEFVNKIRNSKYMTKLRGLTIATIFQDPMTSLNPLLSVGFQISEVLRKHRNLPRHEAKKEAIQLLEKVGIPNAKKRYRDIPGMYSGGMRQRVVIAIALACRPKILICDEPTTALDVTVQAQILDLIKELQQEYRFTTIFITHDLGVVASIADRVAVMYAGQIIEYGTTDEIFFDSKHPYTWSLLSSLPQFGVKGEDLFSIPGSPPSVNSIIKGDAFAPRNKYAMEVDYLHEPPMFKVSDTHYAKTWLLDPRAPKVEVPKQLKLIEKMKSEATIKGGDKYG